MRREWSPEDLIASWTLVDEDWQLVGKQGGRDPARVRVAVEVVRDRGAVSPSAEGLPPEAVAYVVGQVAVDAAEFAASRVGGPFDQVPPGADPGRVWSP